MVAENLQGTNAVAIGSNERRSTIETDVGEAGHEGAVLEPAQLQASLNTVQSHTSRMIDRYL